MAKDIHSIYGLLGGSLYFFIAKHFKTGGVFVLPSSFDLEEVEQSTRYFFQLENPDVEARFLSYPELDRVYESVRQEPENRMKRILSQWQLANTPQTTPVFLFTHLEALEQKTPSIDLLKKFKVQLKRGDWTEREKLLKSLRALGYRQDELAEDRGFYSVRGLLLDIFSPYEDHPYRIEFFGDEIVSIRTFDSETQRSLADILEIELLPLREVFFDDARQKKGREVLKNFADESGFDRDERDRLLEDLAHDRELFEPRWILPAFFEKSELVSLSEEVPKRLPWILIDQEKAQSVQEDFTKQEDRDYENLGRICYAPKTLRSDLKAIPFDSAHTLSTSLAGSGLQYDVLTYTDLFSRLKTAKNFKPLEAALKKIQEEKTWPITLVFQSARRMEALKESLQIPNIDFQVGPLFDGFESSTLQRAFINEKDLFGSRRKRAVAAAKTTDDYLRQFSDLKDGDYVIHEDHGIARFRGLQTLDIDSVKSEFLHLEFAEQDKLYLPIYRVDKISRFAGDAVAEPRLDKLGSGAFTKKKARIREDILRVAHELLQIAAERKGKHLDRAKLSDENGYQEFCARFPYDLTVDQERTIRDVEYDLLHGQHPMDRLVCGDVGFGKTEIALRAAALTLYQGKQVALLAPTTILVEQHFHTFKKRFEDLGFQIEHVSRFVSAADQKKSLEALKDGRLDMILGTHRLLQGDVAFKDLGLLIIDEEQRFGVKHKERLKKIRSEVDILTLSATPIPRTLQMAVFGIRDLSLIATPPDTREAVKTFVGTYDEALIKKAALKERERGGQILFVHNRVQTIDAVQQKLQKLLPDFKIVVAHGQMHENDIETRMLDFIEQRADILLATTIIENGLDIPNANTLFVDHAERFGLSELYQLRGRVGRSYRSSYAYFLIHESEALTDEASKRLQVIQSCTELGSGYHVATYDLEIRGSGNLLGEEQSGVIAEVGLELYTQMMEETLSELHHSKPAEPLPELNSGYTAYVPEFYIPDASVRISMYKRINKVQTQGELLSLEEELMDRFGLPPLEVENLCQLTRLRILAHELKAQTIDCFPGRLALLLKPSTPLDARKIIPLIGKGVALDPKGRLTFSFISSKKDPELAKKDPRFSGHPELYDFSVCRAFLNKLQETAGIDEVA